MVNWTIISIVAVGIGGILLLMELIDQSRKHAPKPGKAKHPFAKSGKRRSFSRKISKR